MLRSILIMRGPFLATLFACDDSHQAAVPEAENDAVVQVGFGNRRRPWHPCRSRGVHHAGRAHRQRWCRNCNPPGGRLSGRSIGEAVFQLLFVSEYAVDEVFAPGPQVGCMQDLVDP